MRPGPAEMLLVDECSGLHGLVRYNGCADVVDQPRTRFASKLSSLVPALSHVSLVLFEAQGCARVAGEYEWRKRIIPFPRSSIASWMCPISGSSTGKEISGSIWISCWRSQRLPA